MKKEKEYFELRCQVDNRGEKLAIKLPELVASQFECAAWSHNSKLLSGFSELFSVFGKLSEYKRKEFQNNILQEEHRMITIDDVLECIYLIKQNN